MAGYVRRGKKHGAQWETFLNSARRPSKPHPKQAPRIPKNLSVEMPESKEFYDTPSVKAGVGVVAVAVIAKLTMMYDESKEPERVERRAKEMIEQGGGEPQMVSRELWDHLRQLPPRTPFESRTIRDRGRIRSGEPVSWEDYKNWAIDVLTEALARKEDSFRH